MSSTNSGSGRGSSSPTSPREFSESDAALLDPPSEIPGITSHNIGFHTPDGQFTAIYDIGTHWLDAVRIQHGGIITDEDTFGAYLDQDLSVTVDFPGQPSQLTISPHLFRFNDSEESRHGMSVHIDCHPSLLPASLDVVSRALKQILPGDLELEQNWKEFGKVARSRTMSSRSASRTGTRSVAAATRRHELDEVITEIKGNQEKVLRFAKELQDQLNVFALRDEDRVNASQLSFISGPETQANQIFLSPDRGTILRRDTEEKLTGAIFPRWQLASSTTGQAGRVGSGSMAFAWRPKILAQDADTLRSLTAVNDGIRDEGTYAALIQDQSRYENLNPRDTLRLPGRKSGQDLAGVLSADDDFADISRLGISEITAVPSLGNLSVAEQIRRFSMASRVSGRVLLEALRPSSDEQGPRDEMPTVTFTQHFMPRVSIDDFKQLEALIEGPELD